MSQIKLENHIVLLGWNPAGAKIIEGLVMNDPGLQIVMVNQLPEESVNELLLAYKKNLSFVRGDYTRETILRRANIDLARSTIIIPDSNTSQTDSGTEDKTLLAVLTVKGISRKVNVVVYSASIENRPHLKRAGADAVITPENWIASSLTAQVLSPAVHEVMQRLMVSTPEVRISQKIIPETFFGKSFGELAEYYLNEGRVLLGTIREEKKIHIDDILSDDSSFLDEFIRKRFAEAGRTNIRDNNIETRLMPPKNTVIVNEDKAIVAERI